MGCDAAADVLTVLFSFPFSHHHSLTVLHLSKTHIYFSLLLSLEWLPSALLSQRYSLIVWSALSLSIYRCCSPYLFHITIFFFFSYATLHFIPISK